MRLADVLEAQRGTAMLWVPVALAAGIGAYFSVTFEPGPGLLGGLGALALLCLALAVWTRRAPAALP
ncbi:MAG: hypothetical protein AAFY59_11300, partial [Pseudomonadota bacterium]